MTWAYHSKLAFRGIDARGWKICLCLFTPFIKSSINPPPLQVCVAAGVATALVWVGWAVAGRGKRHPGRPALLLFMLLAHAALALEVLDFPPIIQGPWKVGSG